MALGFGRLPSTPESNLRERKHPLLDKGKSGVLLGISSEYAQHLYSECLVPEISLGSAYTRETEDAAIQSPKSEASAHAVVEKKLDT